MKRAGRAFTLIEVLVVLALIGLLATLLVAGSMSLLRDQGKSPVDIFWQACLQARRMALQDGQDVRLTFDDKAKAFVMDDDLSQKTLPVPSPAPDLKVTFVPVQDASGTAVLIGGTVVSTESLPGVTFFHDGICSPFKAQFYVQGAAHLVSIDPWTCAPVLPAPTTP